MKQLVRALALVLVAGLASATTITTYDDTGLWNVAIGPVATYSYTDNLDDSSFEWWLTIASDYPGQIANFQWQSKVGPGLNDTFTFSALYVIAWGATFNLLTPGGPEGGIEVWANLVNGGWTYVDTLPGTYYQKFFGFVVDGDYLKEVQLRGGGGEDYWMDDLKIAGVPEPSTMGLLGLGLVSLVWGNRRRHRL